MKKHRKATDSFTRGANCGAVVDGEPWCVGTPPIDGPHDPVRFRLTMGGVVTDLTLPEPEGGGPVIVAFG